MKLPLPCLLAASLLALAACDSSPPPGASTGGGPGPGHNPQIYTTFYPTQYFAERIAGDTAEVICPVPPDEDAIFWQPDAEAIAAYQNADLIVLNGAGFAQWVGTVSLPESKVVDTAAPFSDRFIYYEEAVTHSHGAAGEHSHAGLDGHTWVDPINAKIQAAEIEKALAQRFPKNADLYAQNLAALEADLDALDATLKEYQTGRGDVPLLASHPAYNYIAERYGWNLTSLDLDPEEMPDDEQFAEIKSLLDEFPARHIIWEGAPTEAIANRFESELGLSSIVFSPAELYDGTDYLTVMQENVARLRHVFEP
ncbi:zinc ABC transporter substrate-binding protein [soil metagenome]